MKNHHQFLLSSVTLAVLTLMSQAHAAGQSPAATTPAAPAADSVSAEIQTVVVTGTASSGGVRKIDASYSITTANEEQLKSAAPTSTADLLKIVPGVFAEASGGVAGANIAVRGFPSGGDAPYVTIQLNGSPLYPAPSLSFLENSSLFRIDDSVERVEVLRGGPSTVFSNGQPGATVNFITKKGTDTPEGTLRLTTGTGSLRRVDAFFGGKIGEGWYGTIGGFHRSTHSVRDAQFPADKGGQINASITRKLDDGELHMYARVTNDKNAFYTGVPLISATSADGQPSAYPGFDPLTGTLSSNELRNVVLEIGPNGQTLNKDLADGRGLKSSQFGVEFSKNFNGWAISNKASFMKADAPTLAIFAGGSDPLTMKEYVDEAIEAHGVVGVTTGAATYAAGGGAVADSQNVLSAGIWSVEKNIKAFTDELRISKEVLPGHRVTAGAYFADFSTDDQWYLGNSTLMTATSNARPINVALSNGVIVSANGRDGASFFTLHEKLNGRNAALFLSDEWKLSDKVTLDAGVRHEKQRIDGFINNPLFNVDLDNNPLTVYNNNASVTGPTNTIVDRKDSATSYTVGGLYKVARDFSVFARLNSGVSFPQFDTIRSFGDLAPMIRIKQYEIGLKSVGSFYSAYLTAFHTDFNGLPFSQILDNQTINALAGASGNGVEFEVALRPVKNLQIALTGNYQDSTYKDFPEGSPAGTSGNRVQRQPKFQARLTPSYRIPMSWGDVKLHATYTHIGDRWSDTQNQQLLPGYDTVDAGILVSVGDKWEFRVTGNNLTNEFGLTEGNARIIGGGSGVVFGRPIFGRSFEASLMYRF